MHKRKKVAQPSVASHSDLALAPPITVNRLASPQASLAAPKDAITQPAIPQAPDTRLPPTSPRPRMSDQDMLEYARQLFLADSP